MDTHSSCNNACIQTISVVAKTRPRYSDSTLLRDTTFCLVEDQKTKLPLDKLDTHLYYAYH